MSSEDVSRLIEALNEIADNDSNTIFVAVFSSVLAGVILYILNEIIKANFFIPRAEYKRIRGQIVFALHMYANAFANPIDDIEQVNQAEWHREASRELRKCASELSSFAEKRIIFRLNIPSRKKLQEVGKELILLSNGMYFPKNTLDFHRERNIEAQQHIEEILKIRYKK